MDDTKVSPPPQRIWIDQGETRCSRCYRKRHCCSVIPVGEVCYDCLLANGLAEILRDVTIDCIDLPSPHPSRPDVDEDEYWAAVDQAHLDLMEAVRWKMYGSPAEARVAGYKSLVDAIRSNGSIARTAAEESLDLPKWVDAILKKVAGA